ncbi:oligopeptide transport system permease protein [Caminicella sporogenes DSM 14501]|uniref:Oligopeptide transport system permease protein n=1 Tax=Caminicella sporogenes DSM 14501 TaxID=1121266 RepID=A0A1M6T007_9FIRM|nr:ABC transporter permease [Caminicella sporogenes]RKD26386.1 peptide ABC transporter permease [Caminicella sporogenes]SHK50229.1 oligopeptide transport system permease protein [Caminicella sporogenes DSM 14501]
MAEMKNIPKEMWEPIAHEERDKEKITRPSMTYWQDAWRRLKQNKLAMIGLVTIIILFLFAIFGPMFSKYSYSDQNLDLANIPPRFEIYKIADNKFVYVRRDYMLIEVTEKGEILDKLVASKNDMIGKKRIYNIDGNEVVLDYSFAAKNKDIPNAKKFALYLNGKEIKPYKKVFNKTYWFGSDAHGRDLYVRVLYGARISLSVAVVAAVVNFFIGVLYGGISGYAGGKIDNMMMRIVDIISTVPLMLYVIMLMVVMGSGLKTIMITLGTVYWVRMARIVRGQTLSLKEQEYVLAAKTLGASTWRILVRHLIPNAMGPIIVALTMQIPSAIFTESFLSFIGLGVSAPAASWGTLASDALGGLRSYAYQLFFPSLAICITMLAFNFLGDGLRDALDPRLRK